MINYKKLTAALMIGTVAMFSVTGCTLPWDSSSSSSSESTTSSDSSTSIETVEAVEASESTLEFDSEDLVSTWNESDCTTIQLSDSNSTISGSGATVSGSEILISSSGTYVISGTLTDGSIHVNVADKSTVRIILNGVSITSSTTSPILVEDAKKVIITLADGTTNTLTDSARGTTETEEYTAALYSKSDTVINGTGTLNVNAGYKNGIKSADDLKIVSGTFVINSTEDGIIGKDLLGVKDGDFTINAGCDGMKSTYDTDTSKGNVILLGGTYDITAGNDGIQAENSLIIEDGTYDIETSDGAKTTTTSTTTNSMFQMGGTSSSSTSSDSTESYKGLKATYSMYINGGTINLNCADDALHTNSDIVITDGTLTIKSSDDGIHADESVQIDGGTVDIQQSYEGIEATTIAVNGGDVSVVSSDDGFNASSGSSDSTSTGFQMGAQTTTTDSSVTLEINGGTVYVDAGGDGLDANGSITINGGNTIVCGPTDDSNTAVDFDSACTFNGGTLMAFGSNGMIETPTSASNGACVIVGVTTGTANSEFTFADSNGNVIMSYTPSKAYECAILYSSDITTGNTYTATANGTSQSVTVSSSVTSSVSSSMGGGMQSTPNQGGQSGSQNNRSFR